MEHLVTLDYPFGHMLTLSVRQISGRRKCQDTIYRDLLKLTMQKSDLGVIERNEGRLFYIEL